MKKLIALILIGCLFIPCLCVPIIATDSGSFGLYRWSNIAYISGSVFFNGTSGNYSMVIIGDTGVNKITATATLYYKNSSGNWVEIPKDWTYSVNSDQLTIDEDFTGVSGREYKVELEATVYKDGYGEPVSKTTTKTCP